MIVQPFKTIVLDLLQQGHLFLSMQDKFTHNLSLTSIV
jgi:hypothetical protein